MIPEGFRLILRLPRFAVLSCCVLLASVAYGQVTPNSLTFLDVVNGSGPAPQTLTIAPSGFDAGASWTASADTLSGGNWLSITPQQGTGNGAISVSVVTGSLPAGTYQGQVNVQIDGETSIIQVTFNVAPTGLSFTTGSGGANPPAQTLQLSLASGGSFAASWSASVSTNDGANWLSVSPTSGTASSLSVSVNSAGLAAGTYYGTVSLSGAGPAQTPVVFNVVTAATATVTPSQLIFSGNASANPASQALQLTVPPAVSATNWTVAATTASGGNWLTATPASGSGSATITVAAATAGLSPGSYTGTVTVTFPGSAVAAIATSITLTVLNPLAPSISPTQLTFSGSTTANPANQTLQLTIPSGSPASTWTVSATTASGGNWLSVTPASGTGGAAITVAAASTGLAVGSYSGSVTVNFPGSSVSPIIVPVTLSVINVSPPTVSPTSLSFVVTGGVNPGAQALQLTIPTGSPATVWTVSITTASGGNWLGAAPASGSGSSQIGVGTAITGLVAGTYTGTVTIAFPGTAVASLQIPVTLTVSSPLAPVVTPTSLSFAAPSGTSPASQALQLTIPTSSSANVWTVSVTTASGGNWLSATPASGSGSGSINVSASVTGLATGTYTGTVTVSFPGATVSPIQTPVTFAVGVLAPTITPTLLTFSPSTGSNPPSQTLQLTLPTANATTNWAVAASTSGGGNWLSATPATGTGNGAITVSVDITGLPVGAYTGVVTVTFPGSTLAPILTPVTLSVQAPLAATLTPAQMSFAATLNISPVSQTMQLALPSNASTTNWSVSSTTAGGGNWLSATPATGTGNGTITVAVNSSGLAVGSYSGVVVLTFPGSSYAPVLEPVTVTVSAQPTTPTITPSQLSFSAPATTNPANQTLQLTLPSPSSSTQWTVAASTVGGGNWLSATPASGTDQGNITVAVNITGLAAGSYAGTITVNFPGSTVTPIQVPVILSVGTTVTATLSPLQLSFVGSGTNSPAPQALQLTVPSSVSTANWSVSATTISGGTWLTATPATGAGSGTITVAASITGLSNGTYSGVVTVTFPGSTVSPVQAPVTFLVGPPVSAIVAPTQVNFTAVGTTNPANQTVQLTVPASLAGNPWTLGVSTAAGGNWLTAAPGSGVGSGSFTVSANVAGLAAGSYAGAVFVSFANSSVATIQIPVTLSIGTSLTATVTPAQVSFSAPGASNPASQTLQLVLPAGQFGATFNVTTTTLSGGNWLGVTPQSGTGGTIVTVAASVAGLVSGTYSGVVTITFPGSTVSPLQVPVTLVATLQTLSVSPTSLTFAGTATQPNPATQMVTVTVDPSVPNWNAAAVTTTGGNWLSVAPNNGVGNGTILVSVNIGSLVGQYVGQVLVTSGAETASFSVTLNVATTGISVTPTSLAFTANTGSSPAPQTLSLTSSISPGTTWQASATTTTGGSWLSVSPAAGQLPGSFQASVSSSSLLPGSYSGTITITDTQATPSSIGVPVKLTVNAVATGTLTVSPTALTLQGVVGVALPPLPTITISTTSATSQNWTATVTTSNGGNWLGITETSGSVSVQSAALPQLIINSSNLTAGVYGGQIAIQFAAQSTQPPQIVNVQLTMSPAGPRLALGQSGVQLSSFAGSNSFVTQNVAIANVGSGTLNWTANVLWPLPQVSSGPDWLLVEVPSGSTAFNASGTATAGSPGTLTVVANGGSLPVGNHYGVIGLTSQAASSSTQYLLVGLTVLPSGTSLSVVYPQGLVFVEGSSVTQGTVNVQVASPSTAVTVTYTTTASWMTALPSTFTGSGNVTIGLTSVSTTLPAGVYQGTVTIVPSGSSAPPQDVQVYYIVPPSSAAQPESRRPDQAQVCSASSLVMVLRQLGQNFSYPTGLPVGLEAQLLDNCGNLALNATVTASFSNGDTSLTLVNLGNGIYSGTWDPVTANAATTVTIQAIQAPLTAASTTVNGAVTANPAPPPFVGIGGLVNGASFAPLINVAPGSIVSVFGGNLATSNGNLASFPLPTVLGGIKLSLGGEDMPLFYAGTGQVNAQVPFDLPVNAQTSLVARAISGTSESDSVPIGVTLGETQPGIFMTGTASQGAILNVSNQVVNANNPATAGDVIVIFCTGLGPTAPTVTTGQQSPQGQTIVTIPATVTIGGVNAPVQFAGLAPGFVGLYQVNAVVPAGLTVGSAVPVVISQNGVASNSATIAVH
jgi:uncharacterized protein (TIGR03437 family)